MTLFLSFHNQRTHLSSYHSKWEILNLKKGSASTFFICTDFVHQIYTFVNISLSFGFYLPKNSLSNILSYSSFNSTANFQLYRKFVIFWMQLLEIAPYSSTLAWKIPWTGKPGRLQSMGSQRVGPDWVTSLSFYLYILHFNSVSGCL